MVNIQIYIVACARARKNFAPYIYADIHVVRLKKEPIDIQISWLSCYKTAKGTWVKYRGSSWKNSRKRKVKNQGMNVLMTRAPFALTNFTGKRGEGRRKPVLVKRGDPRNAEESSWLWERYQTNFLYVPRDNVLPLHNAVAVYLVVAHSLRLARELLRTTKGSPLVDNSMKNPSRTNFYAFLASTFRFWLPPSPPRLIRN